MGQHQAQPLQEPRPEWQLRSPAEIMMTSLRVFLPEGLKLGEFYFPAVTTPPHGSLITTMAALILPI